MTAPTAKTDTLAEFLAEHAGFAADPKDATAKNLEAWLAEVDSNARSGARAAYLVGRALRAQRPKHGKVAAWADEQAVKLGRSSRSVRLYLQIAKVIDADFATPLPISIIDRPLRDVPRAIQNVRAGLDPDAPRPKVPRTKGAEALVADGRRAIEAIVALGDGERSAALMDLLGAVFDAVTTLPPVEGRAFRAQARQVLRAPSGPPERTLGYDAWGTPEAIMEVVRTFAARRCSPEHNGRINLDPASSAEHNEVVQAERIFTVEDDGLNNEWRGDFVWLNPPFGKYDGNESNKALWFRKAVEEYQNGHFKEGVVLLPSTNDRAWFRDVTPWSRVDLRDRVCFRGPMRSGSPTPICLVYLGTDDEAFLNHFQVIGDPVPGVPLSAETRLMVNDLFGEQAA